MPRSVVVALRPGIIVSANACSSAVGRATVAPAARARRASAAATGSACGATSAPSPSGGATAHLAARALEVEVRSPLPRQNAAFNLHSADGAGAPLHRACSCAGSPAVSAARPASAPPTRAGTAPTRSPASQHAGFGATVPHPDADPFCVEFDKRRQNVTELGVVDFLSQGARARRRRGRQVLLLPVRPLARLGRAGRRLDEDLRWDGHYFFDKARGEGGVWVTNFNVNGHTGDPRQIPGIPPEYAQYFGPGHRRRDHARRRPGRPARAPRRRSGVYAEPQAAPSHAAAVAPCADAGGRSTHRSIGRSRSA